MCLEFMTVLFLLRIVPVLSSQTEITRRTPEVQYVFLQINSIKVGQ